MRKLGLLLAVSMLFSPITSMTQPPATLYIVEPGDVVQVGQLITGSVTLKSSPAGANSKTGGGCLVYLSVPNAKSCSNDSECKIGNVTGYCASFDRSPGQEGRKACWHRPDPESCARKQSPQDPLQENVPLTFNPPTTPYPIGVKKPVRWRVVSCQNLTPGGCQHGIPDQDKKYRFGEIKQFP